MAFETPTPPDGADKYLELIGLMGLMRVAMFESFGDRRFWDEHYYDLFTSMLVKQLKGSVSTLEDMTGAITGVSYSTKVRMIDEARNANVIDAANKSEVELSQPLDSTSARKVFFLTADAIDRMVQALDEIAGDVSAVSGGRSRK